MTELGRGSVRVTVADSDRRRVPRWLVLAAIALAVVVSSAGVLVGVQLVSAARSQPTTPHGTLDASAAGAAADRAGAVPGSTRLVMVGPTVLLDTRGTGALAPGAEVAVPLPALPPGASAVVLEVSLVEAAGPGVVTLISRADQVNVLRLPRAGA